VSAVFDVVGAMLVVLGALLALAAAVGLLRLPDVVSRMHAATKPQTAGLVLVVLGTALLLRTSADVWMLLLVGAFQLITAPVTAHLVGRLAYRSGGVRTDLLHRDELAERPERPAPE
jgi:multicomponent Na+:H+ antiporter subunit G